MSTSTMIPRYLISSSCFHHVHRRVAARATTSLRISSSIGQSSYAQQPVEQKRHKTTLPLHSISRHTRTSTPLDRPRPFTTTSSYHAVAPHRPPPSQSKNALRTKDRGPPSKETTQTDFNAMNVLGATAVPSTSVDVCTYDGFMLDSGLRIGDGDGVVLTAGEAFVWRPWMTRETERAGVVSGDMLRKGKTESERTGGVLNKKGQWEVGEEAWGVFKTLWPKPDLLIIGTGPTIRPLAPSTRTRLQELGMRIEVLDTRNAASQFNLLATERGVQEVAAALVPLGFGGK